MFWNTLNGLYADERAMVAQVYRTTYNKTLLKEIDDEFEDSSVFGKEHERSVKLYLHGGLTLAERIFYSVYGWGTDEAALQSALGEIRTMSVGQINDLRQEYLSVGGGESLDTAILGDLGGRENFEARMDLRGAPINAVEMLARAQERQAYERSGFLNLTTTLVADTLTYGYYTSSLNPLTQHATNYENAVQAASTYFDQNKDANGNLNPTQMAEFQRLLQVADQHLQTYREARAATADLAANTLATAAGIAVVIASGGVATPLIVALAAGAGGATQALTRMGLNGEFNWEQVTTDVLMGAVNAGTAALSMPANVTGGGLTFGILRRVGGSAFGGGALGAGLPALMSDNTWQDGIGIGTLRVTQAALTGGLASTALPAMIGAGVIAARRALPFVSRVVTSTGTTVASIYDAPWVRTFVTGTQSIGAYLDATLTGWSTKLDEIANRLIAAAPNETEATTRQALRDILASTNYTQIQRDFIEYNAMNVLSANRGQLQTLGVAGTRGLFEDGARGIMVAMRETTDALRLRVNATGTITGGISDTQLDALARRLVELENADAATARAILQDPAILGPSANIPDALVRAIREYASTRGGFHIDEGHVFFGGVNRHGRAVGFHHRPGGTSPASARIVEITDPPNSQGIYRARVEVFDPVTNTWVPKRAPSTFFPDSWSQTRILSEIREAFAGKDLTDGNRWQGVSPSGVRIEGYTDAAGHITTAYPLMGS